MGRIKNFSDYQVPDTLQGCITYKAYCEAEFKRNIKKNKQLEELIVECDRRIEAKRKGEPKCRTQEN